MIVRPLAPPISPPGRSLAHAAADPGGPVDTFRPRAPAASPAAPPPASGPPPVAARLARAASRFATDREVLQVQERLQAARLEPAEAEALLRLAEPLPTWKTEGAWRRVDGGEDGLPAWTNLPPRSGARAPAVLPAVESPSEHLLTSRDLSLEGLRGCLLEFEEGHRFASSRSRGYVEVAEPGGPWQALMEYRDDKPVGPQFLDLSPFDGKKVRVRFRTTLEPLSDPSMAWNPEGGGLWVERFVISGTDSRTSESRGLPLEAVMRIQALDDLLALAAHLEPGPERQRTLELLAGLDPAWRARALPALAARVQQGPLGAREASEFVARLVAGSLVGGEPSHLEEPAHGPTGIEVQEGSVRVGGVLLERRNA